MKYVLGAAALLAATLLIEILVFLKRAAAPAKSEEEKLDEGRPEKASVFNLYK